MCVCVYVYVFGFRVHTYLYLCIWIYRVYMYMYVVTWACRSREYMCRHLGVQRGHVCRSWLYMCVEVGAESTCVHVSADSTYVSCSCSGVQIVVIEPNTPAAMSQSIMRGDVIKFVDNKVTRSLILSLSRSYSLSLSFPFSHNRAQPNRKHGRFRCDIICTKRKANRF